MTSIKMASLTMKQRVQNVESFYENGQKNINVVIVHKNILLWLKQVFLENIILR